MPEHLTRLRGPWELQPTGGFTPDRIALPIDPLPGSDSPIVLRRRFGRPAGGRGSIPCRIRCEGVAGLLRIAINGTVLADRLADEAAGPVEVPVGLTLGPRNLLELTVSPGPPRDGGDGGPWGRIALVFEEPTGSAG